MTPPRPRIVSYSPALTGILFDLGLGGHVVGVTSHTPMPAGQSRPIVGDAFSVNTEAILAVRPDVVMTQVSPSRFAALARLVPEIRIEPFTIETLQDVKSAAVRVAEIAGRGELGRRAGEEFQTRLDRLEQGLLDRPRPRVLFLTDFEIMGSAGAGTFIDQLITAAGGQNVAGKYTGWVTLTVEGIISAEPDVIICQVPSSGQERVRRFWGDLDDIPAVRDGRVYIISDDSWTIPGLHLAGFAEKLARMIQGGQLDGGPTDG